MLAELDFKAHEIQHQKVRLMKLWMFRSGSHSNGDILEALCHHQFSTYALPECGWQELLTNV